MLCITLYLSSEMNITKGCKRFQMWSTFPLSGLVCWQEPGCLPGNHQVLPVGGWWLCFYGEDENREAGGGDGGGPWTGRGETEMAHVWGVRLCYCIVSVLLYCIFILLLTVLFTYSEYSELFTQSAQQSEWVTGHPNFHRPDCENFKWCQTCSGPSLSSHGH